MKNYSAVGLALIFWFLNYVIFSVSSYVFGAGRHLIMDYVVWSCVWAGVEMICLGWIEDTFE